MLTLYEVALTRGSQGTPGGVGESLAIMFDFEWINHNLFDDLYTRTISFFDNSDLASSGAAASLAERALIAPYPGAVRDDILEGRWKPYVTDGSGRMITGNSTAASVAAI